MAVIFKQIDTDGDGLISVEEFSSWCAQDAAADAPPAGAPPPPTGPPAFVVPLLSSDARSRRRGRKDKDDARAAKQPKKKTPSPYGEIGGAMARVDALSKRAGGHVGFNANMLRAELIEKRLAAAKASSEVKVAKVRHAQRYAPSPPNICFATRLACTGVTTSVSGPTLGIDRRKNRRDARRRSRYGTLSLPASPSTTTDLLAAICAGGRWATRERAAASPLRRSCRPAGGGGQTDGQTGGQTDGHLRTASGRWNGCGKRRLRPSQPRSTTDVPPQSLPRQRRRKPPRMRRMRRQRRRLVSRRCTAAASRGSLDQPPPRARLWSRPT